MVDACMRQLCATGWLNFRMRAMLVSFAAYHLWLHWRAPGLFLARQFLDFEPGIHWSQMQMQSGTTGINTLRIYSPAKQARDHDPWASTSGAGCRNTARRPIPIPSSMKARAGPGQGGALWPAPQPGRAPGSRRHPGQARLAQEWPALDHATARRKKAADPGRACCLGLGGPIG
jgi:hypothetical protein